jgi:RNA polymerase sigma factor (sigma-70 family)
VAKLNQQSDPKDFFRENYALLRRLANKLKSRVAGETRDPTEIVSALYIKLEKKTVPAMDDKAAISWICKSLRRLMLDYVKSKKRLKRGGGKKKFDLVACIETRDRRSLIAADPASGIILEELLLKLERVSPRGHDIVTRWFFLGLTHAEIATQLGISEKAVRNAFQAALGFLRAWYGEPS